MKKDKDYGKQVELEETLRKKAIEDIRERVEEGFIKDRGMLECACDVKIEPIDEYEDVLSPMGYNTCDRCGDIEDSEYGLFWLDGFDWEDDNEFDQAVLKSLAKEENDYCAICYPCLHKLANEGRDESEVARAKKYYTEEYVVQVKRENRGEPVCFDEFYWNDWQEIRGLLK